MNKLHPPRLGVSMLLVIFTVLLFGTLAILSLSTALSQQRVSQRSARSVEEYYAADVQAQEIFARLRRGELPAGVRVSENQYRYVCPISDVRSLHVTLSHEAEGWKVLRWQEAVRQEEISETLDIWDGTGGIP